jgi:tRNA(Ile2) C34 agmatinyltransferase TiaS
MKSFEGICPECGDWNKSGNPEMFRCAGCGCVFAEVRFFEVLEPGRSTKEAAA